MPIRLTIFDTTKPFVYFFSAWFVLLIVCFVSLPSPVFAQVSDPNLPPVTGLRLITSPLPINLVTTPGTTVTTELKVKNGGTTPEALKIDLMKFKAYEESGKPQLMDPEPEDEFLKWITFSESRFILAPDEWKTVTATFTVPETASFGYYYAFVFSRAEDAQVTSSKETVVVGGTAVLVLLEVSIPDAKREVTVTEFSVNKRFYEFLPATFSVKLRNTGNVHIAPRGNIFIDQGSTRDIAILEVNSEKGSILPNSNRVFDTTWQDGFPVYEEKTEDGRVALDEQGNTVYDLTWNWQDASKLRFGKYHAKLLLIYDDGHRDIPIEGEVSFWVVPWRLVLSLLMALTLPALLVYFFMKWRMKKMKRQLEQ